MADKEERILISGLIKYKGDTYKTTMFGDKDVVHVERVWQMCMTKQEAIERMAKRLEYEGVNKFECHTIAEWCLDELLKGVKK